MIKAIFYCSLYAILNVSGAALIKLRLKGYKLGSVKEWIDFLMNVQVLAAFVLIFASALIIFKALSAAEFSFAIPVATGINFALTIVAGHFLFRDKMNVISFVGFALILSGIVLLSLNSLHHGQ